MEDAGLPRWTTQRKAERLASSMSRQEDRLLQLDEELATSEAHRSSREAEVQAKAKGLEVLQQEARPNDPGSRKEDPLQAAVADVRRERASAFSELDGARQDIARSRPEIINTDDRDKHTAQERAAKTEAEKMQARVKELEAKLAAVHRQDVSAQAQRRAPAAAVPSPKPAAPRAEAAVPRAEAVAAKVPLQDAPMPATASKMQAPPSGRSAVARRQIAGRPAEDGSCNQQ